MNDDAPRKVALPDETRESNQSMWLLLSSPLIWAIHLLACYITAAVYCAKYADESQSLQPVRIAIVIYTVIALIGILIGAWIGYQRHTYGTAAVPHDFDTPEDRHRFIGFTMLLLSSLSAVATLYVAMTAYFVETCY